MQNTLQAINRHPQLSLGLLVTGMHLLPEYGETWREIAESGLPIDARVAVNLTGSSGEEMAIALGEQVIGFTKALQKIKPDLVLLLGDRGEMLAGAIVALHLNIPIVHIHGGELSGTVDEPIRHAISKLAHYHFTATKKSRERLIRMGEKSEHIFVTGAPGLDAVYQIKLLERAPLFANYGLNQGKPLLLILFHPVVQQADELAEQTSALLEAALESDMQCLLIMPNADAGGSVIAEVIREYDSRKQINTAVHVPRREFLSLVAHAEVMAGNSSSGIIEAASLGTPVVNIGDRQRSRERNSNVIDVEPIKSEIGEAINKASQMKGQRWNNVYGEGKASERIVDCLNSLSLSSNVLEKVNAY
jgi:GDP/UDP-N,N'-diacetylbacillosamine 2-epimerase (hydrolysing)